MGKVTSCGLCFTLFHERPVNTFFIFSGSSGTDEGMGMFLPVCARTSSGTGNCHPLQSWDSSVSLQWSLDAIVRTESSLDFSIQNRSQICARCQGFFCYAALLFVYTARVFIVHADIALQYFIKMNKDFKITKTVTRNICSLCLSLSYPIFVAVAVIYPQRW